MTRARPTRVTVVRYTDGDVSLELTWSEHNQAGGVGHVEVRLSAQAWESFAALVIGAVPIYRQEDIRGRAPRFIDGIGMVTG